MSRYHETLKRAITHTGSWNWWTGTLPESLQLEFSGAQMWCSPPSPEQPPSSLIALRLIRPRVAVFLADENQPDDWFENMHHDKLRPFHLDREDFTLSDRRHADLLLQGTAKRHYLQGSAAELSIVEDCEVVAFRAGPVGFYGLAEVVEVYNMKGLLSLPEIEAANAKWWENWREYWRRKDGAEEMPYDWTCEIIIPAGEE